VTCLSLSTLLVTLLLSWFYHFHFLLQNFLVLILLLPPPPLHLPLLHLQILCDDCDCVLDLLALALEQRP